MNVSHEQVIPALQARIGGDAVTIAAQAVAIEALEARVAELEAAQFAVTGDGEVTAK